MARQTVQERARAAAEWEPRVARGTRLCCHLLAVVLLFRNANVAIVEANDRSMKTDAFQKLALLNSHDIIRKLDASNPDGQVNASMMSSTKKRRKFGESSINSLQVSSSTDGTHSSKRPVRARIEDRGEAWGSTMIQWTPKKWKRIKRWRKPDDACWSRKEKIFYHPSMQHIKPSSALILKLEGYMEMYSKCWNGSSDWPYVVGDPEHLNGEDFSRLHGCKYAMVDLQAGLGNRLLSFVSIFLWAFLTNRVLLVSNDQLDALLCDLPAPAASWWAPDWHADPEGIPYAPLLKLKDVMNLNASAHTANQVARIEISHRYISEGHLFFCEEAQASLQAHAKTVTIFSNQYFATGLWFVPSMAEKLQLLFPNRRVFHHVAHHILNPNNHVWDQITRIYYDNYIGHGSHLGLQIRTRLKDDTGVPLVVLDCAVNISKILPDPFQKRHRIPGQRKHDVTVIFIASLNSSYATFFHQVYNYTPQSSSDVVVLTETKDTRENKSIEQAQRAYVEMWLLSFSNKLLISANSTFGYVAWGLGGQSVYVLNIMGFNATLFYSEKRPSCFKQEGLEPCYHTPPRKLQCPSVVNLRKGWFGDFDPLPEYPHLQRCSDRNRGITVVSHGLANDFT